MDEESRVFEPNVHDVSCGRGAGVNSYAGK